MGEQKKKRGRPGEVRPQAPEGASGHGDNPAPERLIGQRIQVLRTNLGMNFEQLAALTKASDPKGISAATLRRYETQAEYASMPGLRELRILCRTLPASADFLVLGRERTEPAELLRKDLEILKETVDRMVSADPLFRGKDSGEPYETFARQEDLKRARLHTKLNKTKP